MILQAKLSANASRAGFSLLELSIAMVILVFALGSLSGTVMSTANLARVNEERAIADAAARRIAAVLSSTDFSTIFATYNTDPLDDPAGAGTALGNGFNVPGLTSQRGDADGMVGRVIFPTINVAGDIQLREDADATELGMPRDLNGDGLDALDHADDYIVLPLSIRLEWLGRSGNSQLQFEMILVE